MRTSHGIRDVLPRLQYCAKCAKIEYAIQRIPKSRQINNNKKCQKCAKKGPSYGLPEDGGDASSLVLFTRTDYESLSWRVFKNPATESRERHLKAYSWMMR